MRLDIEKYVRAFRSVLFCSRNSFIVSRYKVVKVLRLFHREYYDNLRITIDFSGRFLHSAFTMLLRSKLAEYGSGAHAETKISPLLGLPKELLNLMRYNIGYWLFQAFFQIIYSPLTTQFDIICQLRTGLVLYSNGWLINLWLIEQKSKQKPHCFRHLIKYKKKKTKVYRNSFRKHVLLLAQNDKY